MYTQTRTNTDIMAYIDSETVKEIRNRIKETFTSKEGWKFSVTREHHSLINIQCMKSPLRFSKENGPINDCYIDSNENENERCVFGVIDKIITKITGGQIDRNIVDLAADYCDCNFYKRFRIGKWDKDCEFINC